MQGFQNKTMDSRSLIMITIMITVILMIEKGMRLY